MHKVKKFWRTRNIILIVCAALMVAGGLWFFVFKKAPPLSTIPVERGAVISEVSATGKVSPIRSLDLGFERSGRIQKISVRVGDVVTSGQKIIELDGQDLRAQLVQADATVRSQKARLAELLAGTRPEQIRIQETVVEKAKQDLENLYGTTKDITTDAFAKSDDAVRTKISALFVNPDSDTVSLSFQVKDSQVDIDLRSLRVRIGKELTLWRTDLSNFSYTASHSDSILLLQNSRTRLGLVNDILTRALDGVDSATNLSETDKAAYKANIYAARTNVNIARTSVTTLLQSITTQENIVKQAEDQLALQKAGSTKEQIDQQRAAVEQAQANVSYASSQLEKTVLRAPFSGTITKVVYEVGDIVNANTPVVSLIGSEKFQIEVNVPESDISKVKVGDSARVTLDAYGKSVIFKAEVMKIDLSETMIEGVATYKTTLRFLDNDDRILSGLTANIDILSGQRENVLYIPTRNIRIVDGKFFVTILTGTKTKTEVEIKTGLRGSDGRTEILSGLSETDKILAEE
jgi:HlyD family secretion protein